MVVISRILTISRIKPIRSLQFCTPTEAQQKKINQSFKAGNSSDIFRAVVPWNFGLLLTCFVLTDNLNLSLLQTLRIMATLSNGIPISNSIRFLFAQFLFSVNCSWEFVVKAVFFFHSHEICMNHRHRKTRLHESTEFVYHSRSQHILCKGNLK